MTEEGHISTPVPRRRLLAIVAGGAAVAALIVFGAILPAEFNRDPLGIGKATGLSRLWAPKEVELKPAEQAAAPAHDYPMAYRTDVVEIPLRASGDFDRLDELEYKVRMKKGQAFVYSWEVGGIPNPEEFYHEFHGHDLVAPEKMTVAYYKKSTGTSSNGVLVAPFDGVHGWYLQNQSVNPVVVKLRISGFYELIPPGQTGNEAGIIAGKPASEQTVGHPQG